MVKEPQDLLQAWGTLNKEMQKITEEGCAELLKREKKGRRRLSFLLRIYGRFNKLRTQRERNELVGG